MGEFIPSYTQNTAFDRPLISSSQHYNLEITCFFPNITIFVMKVAYLKKMLKIAKTNTGATFRVRVQPGASKNEIMGVQRDALKVKINAPALKGKANKALVGFTAAAML